MLYLDTETCGLRGICVLIQYAEDDGPVELHNVWTNTCESTLALIEKICTAEVCAFNLTFDWFHLSKLYSILKLWCTKAAGNIYRFPDEHIQELKDLEREAVTSAYCLKPASSLDLMLVAQKREFQDLMDRKPFIIRRVPREKAVLLQSILNDRLFNSNSYNAAYFAKSKVKGWRITESSSRDTCNLTLRYAPSLALKSLMAHYLKKPLATFKDVAAYPFPDEDIYDPCGTKWEVVLALHIKHWELNTEVRQYASDDVDYLRQLRMYMGMPEAGDDDSVLAAMVGTIRWSGFKIDTSKVDELKALATKISNATPKAPNKVTEMLKAACTSDIESSLIKGTDKYKLVEYAQWKDSEPCLDCNGLGVPLGSIKPCATCKGTGSIGTDKEHPVSKLAQRIMTARSAAKEVELYEKLLTTQRFHAGFKVIGTKSTRMSGADGLNPQGIKRDPKVRECFVLHEGDEHLEGGDFESFEVALMEAEWKDPKLRETLLSTYICPDCAGIGCKDCNGTGKVHYKLHGLVGAAMSGLTYEEVIAAKGKRDPTLVQGSWYANGKTAVFAMGYGGNEFTLKRKLGLTETRAKECFNSFITTYPGIAKARREIADKFTAIHVDDEFRYTPPVDYCETFLGFRRYFTLENETIFNLYTLAMDIPEELKDDGKYIIRNEAKGTQSLTQAIKSALLGAAIGIQNANMRAAGNHRIQSPGGQITKELERNIWELQPTGVGPFVVKPLNIHDEVIVATTLPAGSIAPIVTALLDKYREHVPMIDMQWKEDLKTWADK